MANLPGSPIVTNNKVITLEHLKVSCRNCSLSVHCLPMGLSHEEVDRLDAIVKRSRPFHRGDHLFTQGQPFQSLFVVKTGSIKTYLPEDDGGEQVLGFHLPGETLGLDAIEEEHHHCSAKILETSSVCEIPFDLLEGLSTEIPSLQHQLFRTLSKEISHESDMLALLSSKTAEERLATFLIGISRRFHRRGFSATDFYLSMSRHEIGSFLGLAVETVSRLFSRFHEERLVNVDRRHIRVLELERLYAMAERTAVPTPGPRQDASGRA